MTSKSVSERAKALLLYRLRVPIVVVALIGIWVSFPKMYDVFPLDDSYIHQVYAKNLAETGTFCLNPGEPSMGTSSPLWVAVLAIFYHMNFDMYWTIQILSLLSFAVLCFLAMSTVHTTALQLNFSEEDACVGSLLAGGLLISNGSLLWFSLSGMETMFFLCICFFAIRSYSQRGFDYITGIFAGLAFLARAPGGLLCVVFVLFELWRKRRSFYLGLISMGVVISPYLLLSLEITGKIIPTTAKGKLLTYVRSGFSLNEIYWYLKTLFLYQKYQPQVYFLLAVIMAVILVVDNKYRGRWRYFGSEVVGKYLECSVLVVWGIMHITLYAVKFRILHQNTRYLANEYVIITILGSLGFLILRRLNPGFRWTNLLLALCMIFSVGNLFFWQDVYAKNIEHISELYLPMGRWIRENTPHKARVAAFDIGIVRYVGDRYTIDLGGLSDPAVHPYLKKKRCGNFVRKKKADYIMLSRNPEVDHMTGIHLTKHRGAQLLKQALAVSFETHGYSPTALLHTYRLDLNRIVGWFPKTPEGILQLLSYDNEPYQPVGKMVDDQVEFVGYSIDQREVEVISYYTYGINFNFLFKAHKPPKSDYWFHLGFFDPDTGDFIFGFKEFVTKKLLKPDQWPVGKIIQDRHKFFIPPLIPKKKYLVKITINSMGFKKNPKEHTWFDIGSFENKGNELDPLNHDRMMSLSSNKFKNGKTEYKAYFRRAVVKLVTEERLSLYEAGRQLSLPSSTISSWIIYSNKLAALNKKAKHSALLAK